MMTTDVDLEVVPGPAESVSDLGDEPLSINCIEVRQPIGTFYIGAVNARDITEISRADVRRLESSALDEYLGFQRPLSDTRVRELQKYVNEIDASFPSSVLLAVNSVDCLVDDETGMMHLRRRSDTATIIDGQHRIAGLENFDTDEKPFDIIVTVFVEMHVEDQARVFATINLNQTKVNRSLALDLYEFARQRSPQKTAHDIAKLLNKVDGGPFHHRIKMLGTATPGRQETVSQALVVDGLLRHISRRPSEDRNAIKGGESLSPVDGAEAERLPFRNLFVAEDDVAIADNVWNFFVAVRKRWPAAWSEPRVGHHLNRNTGVWALLRFLGECYTLLGNGNDVVSAARYFTILEKIEGDDDSFSGEDYMPGSPARSKLLRRLREALPESGSPT